MFATLALLIACTTNAADDTGSDADSGGCPIVACKNADYMNTTGDEIECYWDCAINPFDPEHVDVDVWVVWAIDQSTGCYEPVEYEETAGTCD